MEAPASGVQMHFGEADPRLHSSYQAEPQSLVTRLHSAQNLQSVPLEIISGPARLR